MVHIAAIGVISLCHPKSKLSQAQLHIWLSHHCFAVPATKYNRAYFQYMYLYWSTLSYAYNKYFRGDFVLNCLQIWLLLNLGLDLFNLGSMDFWTFSTCFFIFLISMENCAFFYRKILKKVGLIPLKSAFLCRGNYFFAHHNMEQKILNKIS